MIEFTNIRIQAALPLHPYLAEHPRLTLRLVVDKKVCGETPDVNGDLVTGIWTFDSRLSAPVDNESLTIAVMAGVKGARIQVVSVTVKMVEPLARVKDRVNGYQDFDIFDSSPPLQLKLVMTCHIKLLPIVSGSSQGVGSGNYTVDKRRKETEPNLGPLKSRRLSREQLESLYAKAVRMPDQDDNKAHALSLLGCVYDELYEEGRGRAELDKAVTLHKEAMQFTPASHPQVAKHAHRLAMALLERFKQSGDLVDLEQAISQIQTALQFTEELDKHRPSLLSNLGSVLRLRFDGMGNIADLENSILCQQQAVELTPNGHPDKPSRLNNLGNALQHRFERFGSLADMESAISNLRKVVELTPDNHPKKPSRLTNLGGALQRRFERFGSRADMDEAIMYSLEAVQLIPDGHPDKPSPLSNLSTLLRSRFEHRGSLADIDDAISNQRKAVEFTPDGHPDKPSMLSNLGISFKSRFERLGVVADMENSISNHQSAVALTPDGHFGKPNLLSNLGTALQARFERFGSLTDIDDAILIERKAIKLAPDGHPDIPTILGRLGNVLQSRFEHLGSLADIHEAISNIQKAVEMTPNDHPNKRTLLSNLGGALRRRFERLNSLADINDAISSEQKAIELAPEGHPDIPSLLGSLGNVLQSRFERLGSLADIDDAISNYRNAVESTPDNHPSKPDWLNNLGGALRHRFKRLGDLSDIHDAISNHQNAVELTPDGHPNKPSLLRNLGVGLLTRFKDGNVSSDLECALSALSTAAKSTNGPAIVRFDAAGRWAIIAEEQSRSPLDAFSCAIELLPRVAWLGLAVNDQHALLVDAGSVVHDAVAAAIRYEEYEMAIVWAEQGRSIVWQNLLGLRSPVDDLRRAHPQLADRLQSIAQQLEGSASRDILRNKGQTVILEDVPREYSKLAIEWDHLIDEIRRIPEFEGFLKPKSFSQLAAAAREGPVVILNANDSQCDALALIPDNSTEMHVSVINIPLERFSYEEGKKLFQALTGLLKSAGVRERSKRKIIIGGSQLNREAKFKMILRILWQDVVKPVLERLAFQTKSKRPPRIWWCATGLLAFLPIHAAGLYDVQEMGEKVSDYVVSSYTPTLTAILELSEPAVQEDFQILMVAQASAPGAPPIPKTEDEVRIVHRLTAGARRMNLMRENATVERVREGMMESNWIHLACHGQQNPEDPMESGFLLHDKILKLSEIVEMSLPKADFAFLSACQTAMGDEKVAEESVHLAAGMFLSGCRGVIATTWSIRDDDAPKIAEDVYSQIFKDGKPNRKEAAYALHEAVKRLRESGAQCTSWVPFIHIGR